jgi:hypothetical protein
MACQAAKPDVQNSMSWQVVTNKNPAARGKAKRRGRNREEAKPSILDDTSFLSRVYSLSIGFFAARDQILAHSPPI